MCDTCKNNNDTHQDAPIKVERIDDEGLSSVIVIEAKKLYFRQIEVVKISENHENQKFTNNPDNNEMNPTQSYSDYDFVSGFDNTSDTEEKIYKCDFEFCNKAYKQKASLINHQSVHTGKKLFKCGLCSKTFRLHDYLKAHMLMHTGEKLQCSYCEKSFTQRGNLLTHERIHTGERPYVCKLCPEAFIRKDYLETHMVVHTGLKKYKCKICFKGFTTKQYLKYHQNIHTGDMPFKCSICDKGFRFTSSLHSHMAIHSKLFKYKCNDCDAEFVQKANLSSHQLVHMNHYFTCEICSKVFGRKFFLEKHMATCHTEEEK